jgi:predicted DsbA family dithiol-disulfide isomerase
MDADDRDQPRVVEVFADVGCPFTHVGLRRFVERRAELGRDDVLLWVRAWPLELVNGKPLDPRFIAEEVDEIRSQVAPDLFAGFREQAFPVTSIPAMALAAVAHDRDPATGERVSLALRDALFEQGRDVAAPEVLAAVATACGLDPVDVSGDAGRHRVEAEHREGVDRGVVGSPHFFTPAGGFFCPSLDIARDAEGHLRITADRAAFDAFVEACLT